MSNNTIIRNVEKEFTTEQIKDMGLELAVEIRKKNYVENEKKEAVSGFNDTIKNHDGVISKLARNIAKGCEMVDVECSVEKDMDNGIKIYYDMDGNEVDREEMSEEDYQVDLSIESDPDSEVELESEPE